MEKNKLPKVNVVMITYNHENYILKAITGVLDQLYSGEIELIIANDCSNDKTHEIINNIILNHKNSSWINYINQDINQGMIKNLSFALSQVTSKYFALCEGDDYWIDPYKLEKQISFLENNTEYSMCFHSAKTINFSLAFSKEFSTIQNRSYDINEIYNSWIVPSASIVLKSDVISSLQIILKDTRVFNWDILLILSCFNFGKVRGIGDFMSIYQFQENGLSIARMKQNKLHYQLKNIEHHKLIKENFKEISKKNFKDKFFHIYMEIAILYYSKRDVKLLKYLYLSILCRPSIIWKALVKPFKRK